MPLFSRFTKGQLPLARVEALSDGVFAVALTLLVLDLNVPQLAHASSAAELWERLREQLPRFLSWLISFVIVSKFWLNHHYIFSRAKYANYALVWLNSIFLMFQSLVPFPTAMMGEYPTNHLAVSFFGIVMAINTVLYMTLQSYIEKHLLKPEFVDEVDPHGMQKALVGPLFYLLGAAVAWIYTPVAFVFYIVTPMFYIMPPDPVKRNGA